MKKEYKPGRYPMVVHNVMDAAKQGVLQGIIGPALNILHIQSGYKVAIQIALGYMVNYIVVDNEDTASIELSPIFDILYSI